MCSKKLFILSFYLLVKSLDPTSEREIVMTFVYVQIHKDQRKQATKPTISLTGQTDRLQ